jgi:hypothetical protein
VSPPLPIQPAADQANWPEALATVTECKYDFGAGQALAFGIPVSKHFRIRYNYNAVDEQGTAGLHEGQFYSRKAIPQGTLFPVRYNPAAPHTHDHAASTTSGTRAPIFVVGIIGSVILSLIWFALMRGCH